MRIKVVIILTILLMSATDGKEASTEPSSGEETVTESMKKKRIDLGALLQQVLITTFKSFLQNLSKTLD